MICSYPEKQSLVKPLYSDSERLSSCEQLKLSRTFGVEATGVFPETIGPALRRIAVSRGKPAFEAHLPTPHGTYWDAQDAIVLQLFPVFGTNSLGRADSRWRLGS